MKEAFKLGHIQAAAKVTAKELTDAGYTAAAKAIADIDTYKGMKVDQAGTNKGVVYKDSKGEYYFASLADFVKNYNSVAGRSEKIPATVK